MLGTQKRDHESHVGDVAGPAERVGAMRPSVGGLTDGLGTSADGCAVPARGQVVHYA